MKYLITCTQPGRQVVRVFEAEDALAALIEIVVRDNEDDPMSVDDVVNVVKTNKKYTYSSILPVELQTYTTTMYRLVGVRRSDGRKIDVVFPAYDIFIAVGKFNIFFDVEPTEVLSVTRLSDAELAFYYNACHDWTLEEVAERIRDRVEGSSEKVAIWYNLPDEQLERYRGLRNPAEVADMFLHGFDPEHESLF